MMRASSVIPAGSWEQQQADDRVVLDFDHRSRRRIALVTEKGQEILLDLPKVTAIRDGDALQLADGLIAVKAADEPLAEICCGSDHEMVRIAWHLGNRHLPVQLTGSSILIRRDHVIEHMLEHLGATVTHVTAPFDPEGGAYGEGQVHGHSH